MNVVFSRLLNSGARVSLDVEGKVGRVVNLAVSANEEHEVFVVGSFKRLSNSNGHGCNTSNFSELDGAAALCGRVVGCSVQSLLGDFTDGGFAINDSAETAGGEDVLAVNDGVEDQENMAICIRGYVDSEALDHFVPRGELLVCEGSHTARALLTATRGAA